MMYPSQAIVAMVMGSTALISVPLEVTDTKARRCLLPCRLTAKGWINLQSRIWTRLCTGSAARRITDLFMVEGNPLGDIPPRTRSCG